MKDAEDRLINRNKIAILDKGTIPGLNGLRVICCILVIFCHLQFTGFIGGNRNFIPLWGQAPLSIFFVISGFLITKLLLVDEQKNQRASLKNFYARRFLRIFPAYYTLLAGYFILQLFSFIHLQPLSWLAAITFTKQFNWKSEWETAHLWSLSVEEVFYLFWPVVFVFFKKTRVYVALVFIAAVVILRAGQSPAVVKQGFNIFFRGDALMIGCLCAIFYNEIVDRVPTESINVRWILSCTVLFLFVTLPQIHPFPHGPLVFSFFNTLFGSSGILSHLLMAYVIILTINLTGFWYNLLNNVLISYLVKLTYSIYLWHQLFISFNPAFHQLSIPVILLIVFAISNLSYFLIERPFLSYKIRFK